MHRRPATGTRHHSCWVRHAAVAALALVATACVTPIDETGSSTSTTTPAPADRIVHLEITGCGLAADRTGSGVAADDRTVLTVAHLVARADDITVMVADSDPAVGGVVAIDLVRDLAIVEVPWLHVSRVETARVPEGTAGHIVGGATSGTVPFTVKTAVDLTTEEILGTEMHSRLGYELDSSTTTGDSGAGAYDEDDRLIGLVFATGEEEPTSSWITASEEIDDFLDNANRSTEPLQCDPESSQLAGLTTGD